jgi:site-specific recombinase XerD
VQGTSPNTVKSYARALALWWTYLCVFGLAWDQLGLSDVGGFLAWLRTGDGPQVVSIEPRTPRFAESTIGTRLRAVTSCYRFHEMNGVRLGGDLVRVVHGGRAAYKPMLEHVARTKGRQRAVIRVRAPRRLPPPVLTPAQIEAICDASARFDPSSGQWKGQIRDRLLWALLAETGLPDLAHLVCTGPADRLESYAEVVGYGFGSGEGVVAGLDFDGAVAAGGLDELAD